MKFPNLVHISVFVIHVCWTGVVLKIASGFSKWAPTYAEMRARGVSFNFQADMWARVTCPLHPPDDVTFESRAKLDTGIPNSEKQGRPGITVLQN